MRLSTWFLSFALAIAAGCSYSSLRHGDAKATNLRFLWASEGFKFTAQTNGTVSIELQKSATDSDALKAVAEGVAKGAVDGMSKAVKP